MNRLSSFLLSGKTPGFVESTMMFEEGGLHFPYGEAAWTNARQIM